jgi:hypothetical protein
MKVVNLGSCHSLNNGLSGWVSFMNLDYAQKSDERLANTD